MSKVANICPSCFSRNVSATTCRDCGMDVAVPRNSIVMVPGMVLAGRYLVGRLLGQGGFGATYLGMDEKLSVRTAIKEYLPFGCANRAADGKALIVGANSTESYQFGLTRFLDEARMLARLRSCRNVVSVFDFFEENASAYIVMEFLQGSTLKELIKGAEGQRLPFARALPILESMLNALTEIHALDILHRDISPDNVMIAQGDSIKLLDFGAARQAMSGHSQKMSVILKPGYAPFEQYLEDGNQGPWSDVYAVAATFYHAVTGVKPVDALQRMSQEGLRRPSELGAVLPPAVETALLKALALKTDDRYRSAAEFKADLPKSRAAAAPAARPAAPQAPTAADMTRTAIPAAGLPPIRSKAAQAEPANRAALEAQGGIDIDRAVRDQLAHTESSDDLFDGKPISPVDLARMIQEHDRYVKGIKNGRRLDLAFRRLSGMSLVRANLKNSELRGALLRNADLSGSNLSGSNLFCADLSGAKLVGTDLRKSDLRGTKFDNANLTDTILDGADCREGILFVQQSSGVLLDVHKERSIRAASFRGADLRRSSFCAAELAGADFAKASAVETQFKQSNLAGANFSGAKVVGAAFGGSNLDGAEFTLADLSGVDTTAPEFAKARIVRHLDDIEADLRVKIIDHQHWVDTLSKQGKRLAMRDCNLSGLQMKGVNWSAAELLNVDLHDIVLAEAKLSMASFANSNMSYADLAKVEACGANFSNCKLVGANLAGADFSTVTSISDAKTRWRSNFKDADLSGAQLAGANLANSRMNRANLSSAQLSNANLTNADLTAANLSGADLTGADLTGAILTDADLTNAKGLAGSGR